MEAADEIEDLVELVTYLYQTIGEREMGRWFARQHFTCRPLHIHESYAWVFNYREGNIHWKRKWHRQARGAIVGRVSSDKPFILIRSMMPRGAEIFTSFHSKHGVTETQDMGGGMGSSLLDLDQQESISALAEGRDAEQYVSFKRDGSLGVIGIIPFDSEQGDMFQSIARAKETWNPTQLLLQDRAAAMKLPWFPVLGTRGSIFITRRMLGCFITSYYCGRMGVSWDKSREQLNTGEIDWSNDILNDTFIWTLDTLFDDLIRFTGDDHSSVQWHSFEMVPHHRREFVSNGDNLHPVVHTELAISSPASFCYLGTSREVDGEWRFLPHFDAANTERLARVGWDEPTYYITTSKMIGRMLTAITTTITKGHSADSFFEKFAPSNREGHIPVLDPEGFVYYRKKSPKEYVYSKIKHPFYYWTHKPKPKNIPTLLQLPRTSAAIYPIINRIHEFFSSIDTRLATSLFRINNLLLSIPIDTSPWLANEWMSSLKTELANKVFKSLINRIERGDRDTVCKILINNSTSCCQLAQKIMEEDIGHDITISIPLCKKIIMTVRPWISDWEKRVGELVEKYDPTILNLYEGFVE